MKIQDSSESVEFFYFFAILHVRRGSGTDKYSKCMQPRISEWLADPGSSGLLRDISCLGRNKTTATGQRGTGALSIRLTAHRGWTWTCIRLRFYFSASWTALHVGSPAVVDHARRPRFDQPALFSWYHHIPITMAERTHRADERRFLDERGGNISLTPNGLNPATIMEKAVRERIVDAYFFKEQCFGVNEADIVNRVVDHVYFVGGTYGTTQKPTPFLCLAFKLLQLAPNDAILKEYLQYGGDKFKYLRALAVFYIRLTRRAKDVYTLLEPYLEDKRKLRRKGRNGTSLTYMDEFVDDLLVKDRVCGTSLWKMPSRDLLEDLDELEPRVSPLGDIEDLLDEDDDAATNGHEDRDDGERSESDTYHVDEEERARDKMEIDREGTPEDRDRAP